MKLLLTHKQLASLPDYGAQDGKGDQAIAYFKFFTPLSNWTWYVLEYDRESDCLFGLVDGFELELGSFSLLELSTMKKGCFPMVERDLYFKPVTLEKIKKALA